MYIYKRKINFINQKANRKFKYPQCYHVFEYPTLQFVVSILQHAQKDNRNIRDKENICDNDRTNASNFNYIFLNIFFFVDDKKRNIEN